MQLFLGGFEDLSGHCRHPDCTELSSMFDRHFQLLWNPTDTDCDRSNSFLGAGYWSGQHLHYGSDTSGIYSFIQTVNLEQEVFCIACEQLWTLTRYLKEQIQEFVYVLPFTKKKKNLGLCIFNTAA